MSPELTEAFASGRLVRPVPERPNLVQLVRALATLAGVPGMDDLPASRELMNVIGPAEHLVFILLDGLGMNLVRQLPGDSFLASHVRAQIQATCPSTTASALTSIATGDWPSHHAITGWFTHLPNLGVTSTILPFADRFSHEPLTRRGLRAEDVMPLPAFYPRMAYSPLTLLPAKISHTTYAVYSRGGTPGFGYDSIPQAIDHVIAHAGANDRPTYTHLYVHDIDTMCHKVGTQHPSALALVLKIDAELARLAEGLKGRARIVISADHGLIEIPKADQKPLFQDDPMLGLLMAPPSGDARLPIFHVRQGQQQAFVQMFQQRFGDGMELLANDEAEQMCLFGPKPMSEAAKPRFGDFVAIAYRPVTLSYRPPSQVSADVYIGQHAGLSPEEMVVPLCVA